MDRKYELTQNWLPIGPNGKELWQIRALRDFADVKAGDLGGYVESENNLQHQGDCWIYGGGTARAYESATIAENAVLRHNASASGACLINGNAELSGLSHVCRNALVSGLAKVTDGIISEEAQVTGQVRIVGPVIIRADALIVGCLDYICVGMMAGDKYVTAFRCQRGYKVAKDRFVGTASEFVRHERSTENRMLVALFELRFS